MATSRQEGQWLLRAQCDDREALERLLRGIQDSLRPYIAGVVGPSDADDVLQDAILSVLTNVPVVLGLSLFINRMTSKILKAIDLSSKQ